MIKSQIYSLPSSKFYTQASKAMREYFRRINVPGLNNIIHDITFGHGQVSMLTPDIEIIKHYSCVNMPIAYSDISGRFLNDGIYLNKVIEHQYPQYSQLMPLFLNAAREKNLHYGENYLHYVVRETDCQHMYTLFFDLSYHDFLHLIANNGSLIKDAIENYHHAMIDLIAESKKLEYRLVLPNLSDFFPSAMKNHRDTKENFVCMIHKSTRLPIYISPQRARCLRFLSKGMSARDIAKNLCVATRTVESYLAVLRKELGCRSSKELISFYGSQC